MRRLSSLALSLFASLCTVHASDVLEALPVTDRILMVHFKDGYVIHHKRGQARSDERVVQDPLDVLAASDPNSYHISSDGDPAYRNAQTPAKVGRKSKGTDFAWFADRWVGDHAVNDRPDHSEEHWLYLFLGSPLKTGQSYLLDIGHLAKNGRKWKVDFNEAWVRSEAVHVNLLGYAPAAPSKFAYLYHWAGDQGGLNLRAYEGKRFWVLDETSRTKEFEGRVAFRTAFDNPETAQPHDSPHANFLDADVYECDFSKLVRPGRYVIAIEGVGCSFPFRIDPDVYRQAFVTVARALYHNRSGIALKKPFTDFERPAPGHPGVTPGFKLQYSSLRYLDYGSESGTKAQIEPTLKGPLESWGWYQDAGDWDSYASHVRVPQELLLAYELNPKAFKDGDLNIPESGNGVPDILDEAAWLPRFCYRLRHELLTKKYGSGGIGLRVDGDPFGSDTAPGDVGQGSWEDVHRLWVVSGEDPVSTFGYAGAAAQLGYCLRLAKVRDPNSVDWEKEARESYTWALAHTLPRDETQVRANRLYAAASLFRLTGEPFFEDQFRRDFDPKADVSMDQIYGPAVYALGEKGDPLLKEGVRNAIFRAADLSHETAQRRGLRWGGNWYLPMLVGQQTTPMVMEVAVARQLTKDPAKRATYTSELYTTCDYFLGTNALNQTWVTGLGPRHPINVFHMDGWYNGKLTVHPGIIPYGPWVKEREQGQGPWDHDWANKSVYPAIDLWPGNERYFDNRCSPLTGEFTIHQNIAPAAAIFGILCAPQK